MSAERICCIYEIVNRKDGHRYVGSAQNLYDRWHVHRSALRKSRHHSRRLQSAWNRDGEEIFDLIVIERVECVSDLVSREQHWIDARRNSHEIYNMRMRAESSRGHKHSPEFRAAISKRNKGVNRITPETRKKMAASMKGRVVSQETRLKISIAQKGKPRSRVPKNLSPAQRERLVAFLKSRTPPMLGKKHSEDTKRRMSEAAKKWRAERRLAAESI
jgi:group I intron endonuclease